MPHSPSESASTAPVRVAVDVGGTFTDIVLEQEPRRWSAKLLTTPDAPETAVLQGIEELLGQAGLAWPRVDLLILGTTLATNALIERKGARTALLTTAGFRDLVEIGLEDRFAQYDIFLDKPEPLVPRPWRFGVTERVDAHGQVLTPLDEAQVVALAGELTRAGIESVAVCLLHSYAHPGHERRIRELLKAHAPQLWVSLSSDVCAEIREYPRLSTVSANAYVQPQVSGYLRRLNDAARQRGLRDEPFLMTSGGAIATLQTGIDEPVRLVESGPAGGAILAQHIAEQTGAARALSFDMGGTTAKICYIDDFEPQVSRSFEFGRVHRHLKGSGLPIRIPVIEMVEIGAGGGSIARVNHLGVVQVGPDSAGSSPGPAAYGNGGELPTVTDAHALIGTVTPERFAVGKVSLQPERARQAIETHLAGQAGLEAPQAAQAIIEVVSENMANAARVHASELGKAAEEHTLIAFGGAAPLHAAGLARKLGIGRVIIPESAGVGSAVGFLWAPLYHPAMKAWAPVRADLGLRTILNLLGPLCNPAEVTRQILGVYDKKLVQPLAEVLRKLGSEHAWIVHGADGMDELTTTGVTHVAELKNGDIFAFDLTPEDAGLPRSDIAALKGGDAATNAAAIRTLLQGEPGPYRDIVLLNTAAALIVAGKADGLPDGIAKAAASIDSGRAAQALDRLVAVTNDTV